MKVSPSDKIHYPDSFLRSAPQSHRISAFFSFHCTEPAVRVNSPSGLLPVVTYFSIIYIQAYQTPSPSSTQPLYSLSYSKLSDGLCAYQLCLHYKAYLLMGISTFLPLLYSFLQSICEPDFFIVRQMNFVGSLSCLLGILIPCFFSKRDVLVILSESAPKTLLALNFYYSFLKSLTHISALVYLQS